MKRLLYVGLVALLAGCAQKMPVAQKAPAATTKRGPTQIYEGAVDVVLYPVKSLIGVASGAINITPTGIAISWALVNRANGAPVISGTGTSVRQALGNTTVSVTTPTASEPTTTTVTTAAAPAVSPAHVHSK